MILNSNPRISNPRFTELEFAIDEVFKAEFQAYPPTVIDAPNKIHDEFLDLLMDESAVQEEDLQEEDLHKIIDNEVRKIQDSLRCPSISPEFCVTWQDAEFTQDQDMYSKTPSESIWNDALPLLNTHNHFIMGCL